MWRRGVWIVFCGRYWDREEVTIEDMKERDRGWMGKIQGWMGLRGILWGRDGTCRQHPVGGRLKGKQHLLLATPNTKPKEHHPAFTTIHHQIQRKGFIRAQILLFTFLTLIPCNIIE